MAIVGVVTSIAFEDTDVRFMARLADVEGTTLTNALTTSISYSIWDVTGNVSVDPSTGLTPLTTYLKDTLQDTAMTHWKEDSIGYNFLHDIGEDKFTAPNNKYRIEYKVTLATGLVLHFAFDHHTIELKVT